MSGQSFLLLQNQEFIMKLKAIRNHLEKPINPLNTIIREFTAAFIDQNRLLLYGFDNLDTGPLNLYKIEDFEEI